MSNGDPRVRVLEGEEREEALREARAGLNREISRQKRAGNIKEETVVLKDPKTKEDVQVDVLRGRTREAQALAVQKAKLDAEQRKIEEAQSRAAQEQMKRDIESIQRNIELERGRQRDLDRVATRMEKADRQVAALDIPDATIGGAPIVGGGEGFKTQRVVSSLEARLASLKGRPRADTKLGRAKQKAEEILVEKALFEASIVSGAIGATGLETEIRPKSEVKEEAIQFLRNPQEQLQTVGPTIREADPTRTIGELAGGVALGIIAPKVLDIRGRTVAKQVTARFEERLSALSKKDISPFPFNEKSSVPVIDRDTGAVLPERQRLLRPLEVDLPPPEIITGKTPPVFKIKQLPPSADPPTPLGQKTLLARSSVDAVKTESGFIFRDKPTSGEALRRARAAQETLALAKRKPETQLLIPQLPAKPAKGLPFIDSIEVTTKKGGVRVSPRGFLAVSKKGQSRGVTAVLEKVFDPLERAFEPDPLKVTAQRPKRFKPIVDRSPKVSVSDPLDLFRAPSGKLGSASALALAVDRRPSVIALLESKQKNLLDTAPITRRRIKSGSDDLVKPKQPETVKPRIPPPLLIQRLSNLGLVGTKKKPKTSSVIDPIIGDPSTIRKSKPSKVSSPVTSKPSRTTGFSGKGGFGKGSFDVLVKKGGQFVVVAKRATRKAGLAIGAKKVKESLAATFKLRPTGKPAKITKAGGPISALKSEFRTFKVVKGQKVPLKDTFIQRRGKRLGTRSERKSIQRAKRGGFL